MSSVLAEIAQLARSRALLALLTRRELTARNVGSTLGVLWLYVQPLAMLAAYFLLFDVVFGMRLGEAAATDRAGLYLVVGMIPWLAFADAMGRGSASLVEAGPLLHKSALPLVLFPARSVLASLLVFAPFFMALLALVLQRHGPGISLLAVPPLLLATALVVFVLVYLAAVLVAAMRDVQQIIGFTLSVGLFCSPVLYPPHFLPEALRWLLWINPMTPFVLAWQDIVLSGVLPAAGYWLAILGWLVGAGVLLTAFLRRSREQIVDWL